MTLQSTLPVWAPRGLLLFGVLGGLGSIFSPAPHGRFAKGSVLIPGKIGWVVMESVGPVVAFTNFCKYGGKMGMNVGCWALCLYVAHYLNRAILSPLIFASSVGPVTPIVVMSAALFNVLNGTGIGAWTATFDGSGVLTGRQWMGLALFLAGAWGNIWHDQQLYRLRKSTSIEKQVSINDRIYKIPKGGLFPIHPNVNYLFEILEWHGLSLFCPVVPTAVFVASMLIILPIRALQNLQWYRGLFKDEDLPVMWRSKLIVPLHFVYVALGLVRSFKLAL